MRKRCEAWVRVVREDGLVTMMVSKYCRMDVDLEHSTEYSVQCSTTKTRQGSPLQ